MPDPRRSPSKETAPPPAGGGQPLTPAQRIRLWREDAAVLRRRGARQRAELLEALAAELEADQAEAAPSELVDLGRAAALSGYTRGHLRRLLKAGMLENRGTDRKPLVRSADLPRKAARAAPSSESTPAPSRREIALSLLRRTE